MAGVYSGQKRGPYSKRVRVDDFSNLADNMSPALEQFLTGKSNDLLIALRKAARKQNLTESERAALDGYLSGDHQFHLQG